MGFIIGFVKDFLDKRMAISNAKTTIKYWVNYYNDKGHTQCFLQVPHKAYPNIETWLAKYNIYVKEVCIYGQYPDIIGLKLRWKKKGCKP